MSRAKGVRAGKGNQPQHSDAAKPAGPQTLSPREIYDAHVSAIAAQFHNAIAAAKTELEKVALNELYALVTDLQPKTENLVKHTAQVVDQAEKPGDWQCVFEMEDAVVAAVGVLHLVGEELGNRITEFGNIKDSDIATGIEYSCDRAGRELRRCFNWLCDEFEKARGVAGAQS